MLEEHLRESGLPPLTRLVWHVIAGHGTARTGDVTAYPPSLAEIAQGSGLGRRAVVNHVNELVKEGWLLRDPGGPGRKTRYRLSAPNDPSTPLVHRGAPTDSDSAPGRTKVVNGDALPSAPGFTSLVHRGAPDPGFQEIQGFHAPGANGARSAAPRAGGLAPLEGSLIAKARAEANRCEVHRTHLNGRGVCAACRSEQMGAA